MLKIVILWVEERAARKGRIDILFVFATIFPGTMEDGVYIFGIKHLIVGIEASEASTAVGTVFQENLTLGTLHICY